MNKIKDKNKNGGLSLRRNEVTGKGESSVFILGFTLIETIIYVAIFSIFIMALVSFTSTIHTSRKHSQLVLEVNDQGSRIVRILTSSIHNAKSVNTPNISSNSTILSLEMASPDINPTIFSVGGAGILYITEGSNDAIPITNNRVLIKDLSFSNYSQSSTREVLNFNFSLGNMATTSSDSYSNNFYGSAALRK